MVVALISYKSIGLLGWDAPDTLTMIPYSRFIAKSSTNRPFDDGAHGLMMHTPTGDHLATTSGGERQELVGIHRNSSSELIKRERVGGCLLIIIIFCCPLGVGLHARLPPRRLNP